MREMLTISCGVIAFSQASNTRSILERDGPRDFSLVVRGMQVPGRRAQTPTQPSR
jgi:hypothetical protein